VMGTPYYMSPEQCEGKAEIDHRADIYALGVILFEMLTGKIPFGGEGYGEILVKHITVQPPGARSIVPDLPPVLEQILFRALAKAPEQRFQSMAAFREALHEPERYGLEISGMQLPADLTERVRVAKPMARREMNFRPASGGRPTYVDGAGQAPSTFRDSVGEVWVRGQDQRPKRHRLRNVVLVSMLAGLGYAGMKYRDEARGFVAAAMAPRRPSTVRVNFNSDPNGAMVIRADGMVLGVTPLSTDVPYGDTALAYVIRMEGYVSTTTSIVPNLASPIFAVLQREKPAPPAQPAAVDASPPAESDLPSDGL
jgi:hypothetical protein